MILFESEKEFEDMLCKRLDDGHWIVEDERPERYKRQVDLGSYGIADIAIGFTDYDMVNDEPVVSYNYLKVVELKITELKTDSLSQIARYKAYFDSTEHEFEMSYVLICKESESYKTDLIFLAQSIEWLTIYTYGFSLTDGITFKELGIHSLTNGKDVDEKAMDKLKAFFEGEV